MVRVFFLILFIIFLSGTARSLEEQQKKIVVGSHVYFNSQVGPMDGFVDSFEDDGEHVDIDYTTDDYPPRERSARVLLSRVTLFSSDAIAQCNDIMTDPQDPFKY